MTFEDFANSYEYKDQKYNFEYFKELDKNWSKGFIKDTIDGNRKIKKAIKHEQNKFIWNNDEYEIKRSKDLEAFFDNEMLLNQSITILALVKMLKSVGTNDFSDEEIYNSYNGLIDFYVQGFSSFCSSKMVTLDAPATNDFADLTHLVYLRNNPRNFIVSSDKIFNRMSNKWCQALKIDITPFLLLSSPHGKTS